MLTWRTLAIAAVAAFLATVAALFFSDTLRTLTRPYAQWLEELVSPAEEKTAIASYPSEREAGRRNENLVALGMNNNVERATGLAVSNFGEVGQLSHESSLWRLSRGVGRLVVTYAHGTEKARVNLCTATLISEAYLITAAHCFFHQPARFRWEQGVKPSKIEFQLGYHFGSQDPMTSGAVLRLSVELPFDAKGKVVAGELACPKAPCNLLGQPDQGYDFAILKLKAGEYAKAQAQQYEWKRLGDVAIFKDHPFVVFQHPKGSWLLVTERHCVGIRDIVEEKDESQADAKRKHFEHLCDTLEGSSGAPVFSRDHEVITGIHVEGQRLFGEAEHATQTSANGAIHVHTIAAISRIVGERVSVERDPPTAEQRLFVDHLIARAKEAMALLRTDRDTLASAIAAQAARALADRRDAAQLRGIASEVFEALYQTVQRHRELRTIRHKSDVLSVSFSNADHKLLALLSDGSAVVSDTLSGKVLFTLKADARIVSATFGPGGRVIATTNADNTIGLWGHTGQHVATLRGHTGGPVYSASFDRTGERIVSVSDDETARVWNVSPARAIAVLSGHTSRVLCAAFSPDGSRVVTGSLDYSLRIWEARTGRLLRTLIGHSDAVNSVAYTRDGLRILSGSQDGTARVWDGRTGDTLAVLKGHQAAVKTAAFNLDESQILTSSFDGTARLWHGTSGISQATLIGHLGPLWSTVLSPDGRTIATASMDRTVRLWRADTGTLIAVLRGDAVAFDSSSTIVATTSDDRTLRLWSARHGDFSVELVGRHGAELASARFSKRGDKVITAARDRTAVIWSSSNGQPLITLRGHEGPLTHAEFSRDGDRAITSAWDTTGRIWDARTGNPLRTLGGHEHNFVEGADLSRDGGRALTWALEPRARLWNGRAGTLVASLPHSQNVSHGSFSQDGLHIVTTSDDGTARIWRARDGTLLKELKGHRTTLHFAAFDRSGAKVVTASRDKTARIWTLADGRSVILRGHEDVVWHATFDKEGEKVATASFDGTARLWDANNGHLIAVLRGHVAAVITVDFSPDSRLILTASRDASIRLWDASNGAPVSVLTGHSGGLVSAVFAPDGKAILSASVDRTAKLWPVYPLGEALLALAEKRLSQVSPSRNECSDYAVRCPGAPP